MKIPSDYNYWKNKNLMYTYWIIKNELLEKENNYFLTELEYNPDGSKIEMLKDNFAYLQNKKKINE